MFCYHRTSALNSFQVGLCYFLPNVSSRCSALQKYRTAVLSSCLYITAVWLCLPEASCPVSGYWERIKHAWLPHWDIWWRRRWEKPFTKKGSRTPIESALDSGPHEQIWLGRSPDASPKMSLSQSPYNTWAVQNRLGKASVPKKKTPVFFVMCIEETECSFLIFGWQSQKSVVILW